MKTLYAALRLILVGAAAASLSACADTPPQRTDLEYRSRPLDSPSTANRNPNPSGQRLTIQSGEGERLNLPWFIEGAQDWVNRQ